jgi:hypothetical protein
MEWKQKTLRLLQESLTDENLMSIRRSVQSHKAGFKITDQETRIECLPHVPDEAAAAKIRDHLESYSSKDIPEWVITGFCKFIGRSKKAASICRSIGRYPCIRALSSLVHWNMHAAAAPDRVRVLLGGRPEVARAIRRDIGNWFDASIAASAAYGDVFLTNDRGLREKCLHLRSRGLLRFQSLSLSEYLEGS